MCDATTNITARTQCMAQTKHCAYLMSENVLSQDMLLAPPPVRTCKVSQTTRISHLCMAK